MQACKHSYRPISTRSVLFLFYNMSYAACLLYFLFIEAVECSGGKVYKPCGSACPKTCTNHGTKSSCLEQCVDGCHCPSGKVLQNGRCKEIEDCLCEHNKVWYKAKSKVRVDCNDW